MPRATFGSNAKKNKLKDLPKFIKGKLFEHDMSYQDLADSLDVTKQAISYRMREEKKTGKDLFTYGDLITLFAETKATDEEILKVMKL